MLLLGRICAALGRSHFQSTFLLFNSLTFVVRFLVVAHAQMQNEPRWHKLRKPLVFGGAPSWADQQVRFPIGSVMLSPSL
jgi:hypothetical protein